MVDFKKLREMKLAKGYKEGMYNMNKEPELTPYERALLSVIWSTEPMGFFDLCNALRKIDMCPAKGKTHEWSELFQVLRMLAEQDDYIDIETKNGRMESFQLTEKGANKVRSFADSKRGLLQLVETRSEMEDDEPPWVSDNDHGKF